MYRAQDNKLCRTLLCVLASEQVAENRNIPQPGDLAVLVCDPVIHESGDYEALTILHFKLGLCAPCAQGGDRKSGNGQRICGVELVCFMPAPKIEYFCDDGSPPEFLPHTP